MPSKNKHRGQESAGEATVSTAKFLQDIATTTQKLYTALGHVERRKQVMRKQLTRLDAERTQAISVAVYKMLPDLSRRTISKLHSAVPGFITAEMRGEIEEARNPIVPFWTWIFGNSLRYKQDVIAAALAFLRLRLKLYVGLMREMPEAFQEVGASAKAYQALKDDLEKTATREASMKTQIAGLERIQEAFARDNSRPVPPTLAEAVSNSASASSKASTTGLGGHEFNYIDDVLIPNMIWNSVFNGQGDSYYDRPRYREERWNDAPQHRADEHSTGNTSVRMDDARPAEEGNASMRMSDAAPAAAGNASVRMSQHPVIADPFSQRGNASVSMSGAVHEDRAESGGGTKY